jgi:hypothetical protein
MCQRVTCPVCGKPGFVGCGRHVEQVLADVPPDARCRCREVKAEPEEKPAKPPPSLLDRLFRRGG